MTGQARKKLHSESIGNRPQCNKVPLSEDDTEKIAGGASESYWRCGNCGALYTPDVTPPIPCMRCGNWDSELYHLITE